MGRTSGSGRKPDPPELRLLKNDKSHAYRYNKTENPKASEEPPVAPDTLSPRAKQIFDEIKAQIEEMYPTSETDTRALILYANNHEQLEGLEAYLRQHWVSYDVDDGRGNIIRKKRPEVEIHKQCKDLELRILTEFGLTPSSRSRVKLPKQDNKLKENPFAKLVG